MDSLRQDLREFLKLLIEEKVEFLVIGGYAVIFHGYTRSTVDLDVLIRASPENTEAVSRVLQRFAGLTEPFDPARLRVPGKIVRMGLPPARVEVHNQVDAIEFDEAYSRVVFGRLEDMTLPSVSLADLRANKKAAGRYKDLADLQHLPPA